MRVVAALGGNALLRRGEPLDAATQRRNVGVATTALAAVADADIPGAAQPLEDGSAPEGYTIKGNKGSMKFHAPGGRWYDATVAEVWFKTAEDAAAAGFVEAGKKAAAAEEDDK